MKRNSLGFVVALTVLSAGASIAAQPTADDKTAWFDCRDLGVEGKGWTETASFYDRVPVKAEGKIPGGDWSLGHDAAGLCIRFTTDSPVLSIRWTVTSPNLAMPHMPATGVSGVDVYARTKSGAWQFVHNGRPGGVSNTTTCSLPPGEQYLLYLPG
jgi:hypothetical protein